MAHDEKLEKIIESKYQKKDSRKSKKMKVNAKSVFKLKENINKRYKKDNGN